MIVEGYYYRPKGMNDSPFSGSQVLDVVSVYEPELSERYLPLSKVSFHFSSPPAKKVLLTRAKGALQRYNHVLMKGYHLLSPDERSLAKLLAHQLGKAHPALTRDDEDDELLARYHQLLQNPVSVEGRPRRELAKWVRNRHVQWGTIGNPCLRDALANEYDSFAKAKGGWVNLSEFRAHFEAKYPPEIWGDPRGHIYIAAARMYGPQKQQKIVEIGAPSVRLAAAKA